MLQASSGLCKLGKKLDNYNFEIQMAKTQIIL